MTFCNNKTHFQWCDTGLKAQCGPARLNISCVCFVRPQPINGEVLSPRLDKPIKFMSSVFFFSRRERRCVWCVLLLGTAIFLPSPGAFSTREQTVLGAPGTIRLSPSRTIVSRVDHSLPRFNKSSISYVFVIFSSTRLSRCCDCSIQTVGLLKAERETATRLRVRERKKGFGHIFRGIKHLGAINRLQPALFQPLCCLWIINVNRDRFVYFECGTTGAEWQDE